MNSKIGALHVVATPIGNLGDFSARAQQILAQSDLVLAEDTRHAGVLLRHFNIEVKKLRSCHEHNETDQIDDVIDRLGRGQQIALISDAGTPLISDPGYQLVQAAVKNGLVVTPVPGPCALIAALSASGMATDRFTFHGFMPAKPGARESLIEEISNAASTSVFYESSHRIQKTLEAMNSAFAPDRHIVVARELTKKFERFYRGSTNSVCSEILADDYGEKGEFVVIVEGQRKTCLEEAEFEQLLKLLLTELTLKSASKIAAKHFGISKNDAYQRALKLQDAANTASPG